MPEMTSHQKKISIVLGTRPEAIKLAPVILALEKDSDLESHVCITAQHREMLDENLAVFGIKADTDLDLMQADQRLDELVSSAIRAIGRCLSTEKPDLVLIQGDTITAFAAALAAFYNGIPVGHVEAGLRSGNMRAPWPEEMNRVLASRLSALHFAPTQLNRDNLLKEGIPANRIFVTGNTIVDALFLALEQTKNHPPVIPGLTEEILESWQNCPVVLITGHRRENFGAGFERICQAVRMLSEKFNDVAFVYPVHLNPNVRNPVLKILSGRPNIHLIDPVSYLPFVRLLNASTLILTDSGGIQEEAPSLGKPVLVMRDTTERPEGVKAGCAKLVGTDTETIVSEVSVLLSDSESYQGMAMKHNLYGDGRAAIQIINHCRQFLKI